MAFERRPIGPLSAGGASRIYGDWLTKGVRTADDEPVRRAVDELSAALAGVRTSLHDAHPAPLFTSPWNGLVAEGVGRDVYYDAAVMEYCLPESDLLEGCCDVVVTGQQPGWLGGPLYTLYKVATAIALAQRRTREGRRTIAVFWSADDDDDHAEAFETRCWIPGQPELAADAPPRSAAGGARPVPVGDLEIGGHGGATARWLEAIEERTGACPHRLAEYLRDAWRTNGRTWSDAQRRFLRAFFDRDELVLVSGNDPLVHAAAAPLYDRIRGELGDLTRLARDRGEALAQGGWHAQLTGRSLARPLFRMRDGRRQHLDQGDQTCEAGDLRPGVMLRALVQDWLLRPVAVVVGPGELAYLRQLDPLYAQLQIERPPIVPRLSGWIAPRGFDADLLRNHAVRGPEPDKIDAWADRAASAAQSELAAILGDELDLDEARARDLAAGRARRYRKGVHSLLAAEAARLAEERTPRDPVWVFPEGARQERRLASVCAAMIWGSELAETMVAAADEHLDCGLRGEWSEFLIEVDEC